MFVKIGDVTLNLKALSCGIFLEKIAPEKWTFLGLAFYDAPSLHTVDERASRDTEGISPRTQHW